MVCSLLGDLVPPGRFVPLGQWCLLGNLCLLGDWFLLGDLVPLRIYHWLLGTFYTPLLGGLWEMRDYCSLYCWGHIVHPCWEIFGRWEITGDLYTPVFQMFWQVLEVVCRILYSVDGDILLYPILHVRPGRCFVLPAINTHRNFSKCKKIEMRELFGNSR